MKTATKEWLSYMFSSAQSGQDLWGHQWRASQQYRYALSLQCVAEDLEKTAGLIMDVGCGLGDFSERLRAMSGGALVIGAEYIHAAASAGQKMHPALRMVNAAMPDLPFQEGFGGISALECLCYLNQEEREATFSRFYDLLLPGGWLLFSSHLDKGPASAEYFTENDARKSLEKAGFQIEKECFNYGAPFRLLEEVLLAPLHAQARMQAGLLESGENRLRRRLLLGMKQTPILGKILSVFLTGMWWLTRGLLAALERLGAVEFSQWLGRSCFPEKAKSHIILLARKPAESVSSEE